MLLIEKREQKVKFFYQGSYRNKSWKIKRSHFSTVNYDRDFSTNLKTLMTDEIKIIKQDYQR